MKTTLRKTLAEAVTLEGVGLHSGLNNSIEIRPAQAGEGISFVRSDLQESLKLTLDDVCFEGPPMRSTLKRGEVEVHTVEHLLAAFHGLGVTDAEVRMSACELPGLDGSAQPYVEALTGVGIVDLEGSFIRVYEINTILTVSEGLAQIVAMPNPNGLRFTYTLDYPDEPLAQGFRSQVIDEKHFLEELAPARTFCLRKEAEALQAAGFGKGAGTHNTLVLDGGTVVDNDLRFPDEPVRHKMLDLLGDLYLLGRPINGHIVAHRSGHGLNRALARAIAQQERQAP